MFFSTFEQYAQFPFDNLQFCLRFELSHFELDDETYRFDYYRTTSNEISWKEDCDRLPEFDLDFKHTHVETLSEKKPYKFDGKSKNEDGHNYVCYYYPGLIFSFRTVRDPLPNIVKVFFPCLLLAIFLLGAFMIPTFDYPNRLATVSIVLLTYVAILDLVKNSIPPISSTSKGDRFIIIYAILSLSPCFYMLKTVPTDHKKICEEPKTAADALCYEIVDAIKTIKTMDTVAMYVSIGIYAITFINLLI